MANWRGKSGSSLGSKITANGDSSHEISILLLLGRKAMKNPDSVLKSKDIILLTKVCILKAMVFSVTYSSESWTIKKADRQRIDAFKLWCWRRLLHSKEIKPVNLKGNQSWILIWRTDAEAEAPVLWPHDMNGQLIGKDPDAGKDWRQKEKRVTEDEMAGWCHQCNEHKLGKTLGHGKGQGNLACSSPRGHEEWDTSSQLNNSNIHPKFTGALFPKAKTWKQPKYPSTDEWIKKM